jgi:nicotinate-nucleotide adenylyltransferase
MLQLACSGYPVFEVSDLERDRPGPSYTVDTLRHLRTQQAGDEFFLLVGSDCLPDLPSWHEPAQIAELATLLVTTRPGFPLPSAPPAPFRIVPVEMPLIEISSSDLRRRIATGRSIRYFVPRAVECYIDTHGLYRRS